MTSKTPASEPPSIVHGPPSKAKVGDVVRTRELCIGGGIVEGRVLDIYDGMLAIERVPVWCSRDSRDVEVLP